MPFASSAAAWQQQQKQQREIDFNAVLAYCCRPAPYALACASPWFRRRMEQLNWVSLVAKTIPAHYPELLDTTVATLIRGDGTVFRDGVALPHRYRLRTASGHDHHNAMLLDELWRKGLLAGHDTEAVLYFNGPTNDVLLLEDMRSVCHVFLSHDASPPTEHLLYWLARPRREEDWRRDTNHRVPLAVDEMTWDITEEPPPCSAELDTAWASSRARGLALHLTEHHLPWLAAFLVTELPPLQELYLSLDEGRMPAPREMWWWIKSMLAGRPALRVLCFLPRPALVLGPPRKQLDDYDVLAPYVEEMDFVRPDAGGPCSLQKGPSRNPGHSVLSFTNANTHGEERGRLVTESPFATPPSAAVQSSGDSNLLTPTEEEYNKPRLLDATDVEGLEQLGSLEVLYMCPSATGSLPFIAQQPTKMKELYLLSNAALQTTGVHGLESLPELEVLWIEGTSIRKLSSLCFSTTLRELHVALDFAFATSVLEGIEHIPTLEVLHLERVTVDALSFVGGCVSLRELVLQACRISFIKALRGVERAPLERVSLAHTNGIRDVTFLSSCKRLRELLLTRCNGISTASIAGLETLPRLEVLALEFTRVDSTKLMGASPSLRHLRLNNCKRVLRGSIVNLDCCATLQCLSLRDTNVINVEALYGSRSLVEIDLSHCKHLEQNGVEGVVRIPTLKVLCLSHTPITSVTFLGGSTSLGELHIDNCPNITNEGLRGIEKIPTLRVLSMISCQASEIGFLGTSPCLEELHIASMERLRTSGLRKLEAASHLRHLNMAFCGVDSVSCLVHGCVNLQYLNLRGCQRLATEGLRGLEELPTLTDLVLDDLDLVTDINRLAYSASLRRLSAVRCTSLTLGGVHNLLLRTLPISLRL
ncbi:putative leucine-rich repeat protein (LRRP) [Trypanosoma conorhini]|uniref:Putative leucine-rich repeat protein (LRRP) n=1 Tax=Trypanosoma conorhini TaxID=83891 RepID=A0A3R7L5X2_9TRYP|nr:putative leucine-rich repeat protein (LRRP) [Trypanosoma conorhini]RNF16832.1 putative leucine-rich repeat protein (LRRP) [Trypanosoma conorhini]